MADACALTAARPLVPEAIARWVSEAIRLMVRLADSDWVAPGASGPQLPTVKSSAGFPGVPLSSTKVPAAVKKSPLLVTRYW